MKIDEMYVYEDKQWRINEGFRILVEYLLKKRQRLANYTVEQMRKRTA